MCISTINNYRIHRRTTLNLAYLKYLILLITFPFGIDAFSQQTFTEYFNQGKTAFEKSDFESANLNFQNAISTFNNKNDSVSLGHSYLYLAMVYGKLNNYPKSEEYAIASKNIFYHFKNDTLLIRSYNILGNLSSVKGNTKEAIKYYHQGLEIANTLELYNTQGSLLINIGSVYTSEKNYDLSIQYFKRGLVIADKIKSKYINSGAENV